MTPILARSDHHNGIAFSIVDFASSAASIESLERSIAAWLDSDEMAHLLSLFGHRIEAFGLRDRLQEAECISQEIFDFRKGGERWEAAPAEFDADIDKAVEQVIGIQYREPQGAPATDIGSPTHALVLGARMKACLLRSELLANLIRQGLDIGHVWGLGSGRIAAETEQETANALGLGQIRDELDAMTAALRHNLTIDVDANPVPGYSSSEVRQFAHHTVPVTTLAARPRDDTARATTSDTYRFFLELAGTITPADHLLIVTSAMHAPFQHAQALGELSKATGARITSVGAHLGTSQNPLVREEPWTTAQWLQEVRSTMWSLRMMYEKVNPLES